MNNRLLVIGFVSIFAAGCLSNELVTLLPGDKCDIECKSGFKGTIRVKNDGVIKFTYTGPNERVLEIECDAAKTQMMERTVDGKNWRQHVSWCNGSNCIHTTVIKDDQGTRQVIDRDGDGKEDEERVPDDLRGR